MFYSTFHSSFNLKESLATIGEKVCAEVNSCLSQHGFAPFTAERETVLKGQIQAVANPDNTICKLIGMLWQKYSVLTWQSGSIYKTVSGMSCMVSILIYFKYVFAVLSVLREIKIFPAVCLLWKQTKTLGLIFPDSRIQKFLENYLASSHQKAVPTVPGGLGPIQRELEEIAVKYVRLVNYNKIVFSPYYDAVLGKILTKEEPQLVGKPEELWTQLMCTNAVLILSAILKNCTNICLGKQLYV